jgi:hypothetical protein
MKIPMVLFVRLGAFAWELSMLETPVVPNGIAKSGLEPRLLSSPPSHDNGCNSHRIPWCGFAERMCVRTGPRAPAYRCW